MRAPVRTSFGPMAISLPARTAGALRRMGRLLLVAWAACGLTACHAGRLRGEGPVAVGGAETPTAVAPRTAPGVAGPVAPPTPRSPTAPTAPAMPPAFAPASGPMDATALARETGLKVEDVGSSVLLSSADVRARFFPGTDRLSIDGRSVPMGSTCRREGAGLVVPAAGVDAVRKAVRDAAVQRASVTPLAIAYPKIAPSKPFAPLPPIDVKPRPAAARRAPGADPSWTALSRPERAWRYIVIHHSDDTEGACEKYDRVHRAKGWDGCGYHFVIGNGTQSGDGEVEVGPRWRTQMHGAHTKTPDNRFNDHGIGVVLVGDFERGGRPTARQYEALVSLTRWLMVRYGVSADRVLRHSDCKPTACPGKFFPWSRFVADLGG